MGNSYRQLEQFVAQEFPGIEVVNSRYPVSPVLSMLAQGVKGIQMAAIGLCIVGEQAFGFLGAPVPQWYQQMVAPSRLQVALGAWMGGNLVVNAATQTGAFEVYCNGNRVFSKLETGRMPTGADLLIGLKAAGLMHRLDIADLKGAAADSSQRPRSLPSLTE